MPRLFSSKARASKGKGREEFVQHQPYTNAHDGHDPSVGYGYGPSQGYEQAPQYTPAGPAQYPSYASTRGHSEASYRNYEAPPNSRSYHPTVQEYPEAYDDIEEESETFSDGSEGFVEIVPHQGIGAVPIVQRESSLTRLQTAFTEHGTYPPPLSAQTSATQGTPGPALRAMDPVTPIEMGTVQDARQAPVMVNSPPRDGLYAEVQHVASSRHKRPPRSSKRPEYHAERQPDTEYQRPLQQGSKQPHSDYGRPLGDSYTSFQANSDVTVVVKRGRYGKDTYYIVPTGAPVIFEDEDGNEVTRMGDFSGNYKPKPLRPVIIEDQYGREVARAGFRDGEYEAWKGRSGDQYNDDHREDRRGGSLTRHSTSRSAPSSRKYVSSEYDDENDQYYSSRATPPHSSNPPPKVVYIDPYNKKRLGSSRASSDTSSRSGSRSRDENYYHEPSRSQPRGYSSPNVVDFDQLRQNSPPPRRPSGSVRSDESSRSPPYRDRHYK